MPEDGKHESCAALSDYSRNSLGQVKFSTPYVMPEDNGCGVDIGGAGQLGGTGGKICLIEATSRADGEEA